MAEQMEQTAVDFLPNHIDVCSTLYLFQISLCSFLFLTESQAWTFIFLSSEILKLSPNEKGRF